MAQPKRKLGVAAFAASLAVGATALASVGSRLMMNGKTVSTGMRMVDGKAYVPIADVARAMGMIVVKRNGGYEIKAAGGAHQVGNLSGKVGDVLFDGQWRFQVLNFKNVDEYTIKAPGIEPVSTSWDLIKWDATTRVMRAAPGYQLVLFQCRVTNGQKTKQTLWTSPYDQGTHTALTDMNGGSHVPRRLRLSRRFGSNQAHVTRRSFDFSACVQRAARHKA